MEKKQERSLKLLPQALGDYAGSDPARFHAPGHKGRGMGGFFRADTVGWDIAGQAEDGCMPISPASIAHAEREMARVYGAEASFFAAHGGGAATQAMLLALDPGDTLLLARDAPRCAYAAAALKGMEPAYILPAFDPVTQDYGMVTAASLDKRLAETGATAVLIASPNLYGMCADIPALSRVAHAHGALLLVDAARGGHFPFSELLPEAMAGYADLWTHAQSESMDALTQAASMHLGACRIAPEAVLRALRMLSADEPPCWMVASLDWSVFVAQRQDWTEQVRRADALRETLRKINGIALLPTAFGAGVAARDRTRVVLDVGGRGLTGYAAADELRAQGVYPEAADERRILLLTTPEDEPSWYARLAEALIRTSYAIPTERGEIAPPPACERCMPLRQAMLARTTSVPLDGIDGRIAADTAGVRPSDVAVIAPGERWTAAQAAYLLERQRCGARLYGVGNGCAAVVDEG